MSYVILIGLFTFKRAKIGINIGKNSVPRLEFGTETGIRYRDWNSNCKYEDKYNK